jgi:hypothetical protein
MKFIPGRRHVLRTFALTTATSAIGFAAAEPSAARVDASRRHAS